MNASFNGKKMKDIETAAETVLSSDSLLNNDFQGKHLKIPTAKITGQNMSEESFDAFLEKRNRV